MFFNCCHRIRYQKLNGGSYKYSSFVFFCFCIVLIAVLNFISPCDGRGSNIFAIAYAKLLGTYNGTYGPLTEPFIYNISAFEKSDDEHIKLSVYFSSVSKIACAVNQSTADPVKMEFLENKQVRKYVRTKKRETHDFLLSYLPGEEQRVFCKISGLLYEPYHVEYYNSNPFYISYKHMAVKDVKLVDNVLSFRYAPKDIQWVPNAPWEAQRVLCTLEELSGTQDIESLPESVVLYDSGKHFTWTILMDMELRKRNTFYCTWFVSINSNWIQMQQDMI